MYSERFKRAMDHVLKWEGGYVDHPDDPGGATKYGISLRFLEEIWPGADGDTIANLSTEQAEDLYYQYFWLPGYEKICDERIATMLFSSGVNMGIARAIRISQQTANNLGQKLKVDGVLGPKTLAALNMYAPEVFLREMRKLLILRRLDIAKVRHPFIRGWVRRDLDL